MIKKISQLSPWWWLAAYVLINLIQSYASPIDADEAYYWMYAHHLDWGYFDHPPMVALLISLGMDWLPGSLGLRFGHVLTGGLTMLVAWDLLGRPSGKNAWVIALLLAALPMLQVYGFIATPDGPLLLFSALLLWGLKKFLHAPTYQNGLVIAFIMAALLYSKYHGVLFILFCIIPILPWLIRQPAAWMAVLVGSLLYLPHLYWQYAHDYPSFRYHLSGRNDPYQFKYTTEYLLNQLVIFNPFLLYYFVKSLIRKAPAEDHTLPNQRFYTACRWLVFLSLGFFLYSTSKGGTEAQWTAMISIPLIYVLHEGLIANPHWHKNLLRIGYLSLALFTIARLALMAPREWLPFKKPFDAAPWVAELEEEANGLPLIFENSYRDPSHYRFYTGEKPAWTFTDVNYRPNQYDIWAGDTAFHNQKVLVVGKGNWQIAGGRPFTSQGKKLVLKEIDNFQVAKFAKLKLQDSLPETLTAGQVIQFDVLADLNFNVATSEEKSNAFANQTLNLDAELPLQLFAIFQYVGDGWQYYPLEPLTRKSIDVKENQLLYSGEFTVPADLPATELIFQLGMGYQGMPPLRGQSELIPVTLKAPEN